MEANFLTFGYLFLRLAPFILVSFFCLLSIFNQDFKGIVYLVGLLFACFVNMVAGKMLDFEEPDGKNAVCNMLTIGQEEISSMPLSQTVFGYTFFYLAYVLMKHKITSQNIPTMVFFPLLIFFDFIWNISNSCYNIWALFTSLVIGGVIGVVWAAIILSVKSPGLLYFMGGGTNNEVCSKPSKQTFKCNVYKNGKLISKM